MEEAERLCDRVAIVDHGRLLALDTVDALVAAHGGEDVPLRVERARLEDVFLRLTGRGSRD
jgi:ABC-2 type transport system ATP-binding protein